MRRYSWEDINKLLLTLDKEVMTDQSTIPSKSNMVTQWVVLGLLTTILVMDFSRLRNLSKTIITLSMCFSPLMVAHKAGNLEPTAQPEGSTTGWGVFYFGCISSKYDGWILFFIGSLSSFCCFHAAGMGWELQQALLFIYSWEMRFLMNLVSFRVFLKQLWVVHFLS